MGSLGFYLLSDVFQLTSFWIVKFIWMVFENPGVRRGAVGWGPALHAGRWRVRFPMGSLEFLIDLIFLAAVWPWDRLSLWQKWVPEVSYRGKAAGAWGWQPYHLQVPIVLKSGSLNLLEPSGPVQACNGIALPLPFICVWYFRLSQTVISQMTVWLLHNWVQEMQLPEVKYGFHL